MSSRRKQFAAWLICALAAPGLTSSVVAQTVDAAGPAAKVSRQQAPSVTARPSAERELVESGEGFAFSHPESWSLAPVQYRGTHDLIRLPAGAQDPVAELQAAKVMLLTEPRLSHEEAVRRLKEIEAEQDVNGLYLEIGGWPALIRRYETEMERPSYHGVDAVEGTSLRVSVAIAVADKVVRLQGTLMPGNDAAIADEIERIGRSLTFTAVADPATTAAEVEHLRNTPRFVSPQIQALLQQQPAQSGTPTEPSEPTDDPLRGAVSPIQRINNGFQVDSEIEVIASTDGMNVIVANNSRDFRTSNDGGVTFPFAGIAPVPPGGAANGDPSLAFGTSGTFYFAYIGFPAAGQCSTGVTSSTNNGQTFTFVANATVNDDAGMAGVTGFPDQEHIAADRTNSSASMQDFVYSTWRDFGGGGCGGAGLATAGPETPRLVCSSDSAANWSARIAVGVAGDNYPRITVGQDGFVYVTYRAGNNIMLNKFSNCDGGMVQQAGFPSTIANITDVTCPSVPGLDRCNSGSTLSSHVVAVDDTNPLHVYCAYSTNTAANVNENVMVQDSLDGGVTWLPARTVQVSGAVNGRRFMSWVTASSGTALVTWYDMRNATAGQNDLADYFCASAGLDGMGNLVANPETRITPVSDPLCGSGWQCAPRATGDSESCSVQPQLAGACTDAMGNTTGVRCDFSDCSGGTCQCAMGQTCALGRGCPKYGDYSGNASAAGVLFSAWASATAPPGITPSADIDVFFARKVVVNEPPVAMCMDTTMTANGSCCVTVTVADVDNGSFDPNGPADIASLCITAVDGVDVGCVQSVQICEFGPIDPHTVTLTITDDAGESDSCDATVTIVDMTPPTLDCSVLNPVQPIPVDDNCDATVLMNFTINDNCCIDPATMDFMATVTLVSGQATFGPAMLGDTIPVDANTVAQRVSFEVTQVDECPAVFGVAARVEDCSDLEGTTADMGSTACFASVVDITPPVLTCPTEPVLFRCTGPDGVASDEVMIDVSATDNCDADVTITDNIPPIFPPTCGGLWPSTIVTFTATDECGNVSTCDVTVDVKGAMCCPGYVDTELTLMIPDLDFTVQPGHDGGPVTTKAKFDVWNQNEIRFSGLNKCITCWDSTLLSLYPMPNLFLVSNLQTDLGKARIDGVAEPQCVGSVATPLLGVVAREITFAGCPLPAIRSALTPPGIGTQDARIAYAPIDQRSAGDGALRVGPPENVAAAGENGSLLVWPKVEIRWDFQGNILRDTFIELTNDGQAFVGFQLYFVNGEPPADAVTVFGVLVERAHDGWNFTDEQILLTPNEPTYWSANSGEPKGITPFRNLDGAFPFGRPDPDPRNPSGRMVRGFIVGWAVNAEGTEVQWNHLKGTANIVDYREATSHEYDAWSMDCVSGAADLTACDAVPGQLLLDGLEYDAAPEKLLMDFFTPGSVGLSQRQVLINLQHGHP